MRHLVSLLAVARILTQVVSASAAPLDYDSLPKGDLSTMPTLADAPKSVPRAKAPAGFLLTDQSERDGSLAKGKRKRKTKGEGASFFGLAANQVDADRMKAGSAPQSPDDTFEFTSCFQTLPVSSLGSESQEWTGGGEPVSSMLLQKQDASPAQLYVAHVERWVESADGVALETSDAWIDLWTRGVRVYRNSRLPLVRVAEPYAGVTVYAGRTERSVEFVVRLRPRDNARAGQFAAELKEGVAFTKDNETNTSSCDFVRIGLDGEPREGQAANVVTNVVVGLELEGGTGSRKLTFGREATSPTPHEVTLRTLSLNLSVSRLSSDRRALAAVSYGLIGDERRIPF